ncbi:hypothetical protein J1605_020310 [Eschrichtius robustus]|uniref:Host cell factor Kelch-repeats domain-containing protein n=1 Tax=Eschrichtius robustus TaxID=9764 RepID=A0AB34HHJ2_ESCRO|nr:hypothetical protein J1605_020310 [Eschrichtius robustus]
MNGINALIRDPRELLHPFHQPSILALDARGHVTITLLREVPPLPRAQLEAGPTSPPGAAAPEQARCIVDRGAGVGKMAAPSLLNWRRVSSFTGPVPRARHGHRAVAIRELMIIFGGGNEGIADELHVYNTAPYLAVGSQDSYPVGSPLHWRGSGSWVIPAPVCVPKLSRSALGEDCRLERRCTSEMPPAAEALTLSTSVEQKGETMSWSKPETKGTVPLPRSLHTASVIGNKMYIFGGWVPHKGENIETSPHDCEWRCTSSFSYLNLDTAEWTTLVSDSQEDKKNARPRPRAGHCAVAIGTRLYFWSGRDGYKKALNSQVCCKDLWYLDTEKPPAPSQVQLIKATTNSFHVKWDEVPTVEGYLLQLNTDLPYQAVSSDSSATPNMQGVRMDPHRQGSNSIIPNSISDTMNSAKSEHTAMKGTSLKNKPELKASTDSNATLHSSLATNASNHNSCVVDMLRKNEGPHTSANIGVLSSCLDLRTVIPETSVSSTVSNAQTMVTQQTIKTESSSTNGAVVKDETSLTTFSTKSEVDETCALPATKISRVEAHAAVMPFSVSILPGDDICLQMVKYALNAEHLQHKFRKRLLGIR